MAECPCPTTCDLTQCQQLCAVPADYRVNAHILLSDLTGPQRERMIRRIQCGMKAVDDVCGHGHQLTADTLLIASQTLSQMCRGCRRKTEREYKAHRRNHGPVRQRGPAALVQELPTFSRRGLCGPEDAHLFDSIDYATETPMQAQQRHAKARAICAHCPIVGECRTAGLQDKHPQGVWGGELVTA